VWKGARPGPEGPSSRRLRLVPDRTLDRVRDQLDVHAVVVVEDRGRRVAVGGREVELAQVGQGRVDQVAVGGQWPAPGGGVGLPQPWRGELERGHGAVCDRLDQLVGQGRLRHGHRLGLGRIVQERAAALVEQPQQDRMRGPQRRPVALQGRGVDRPHGRIERQHIALGQHPGARGRR
jgi:hypothetical protein